MISTTERVERARMRLFAAWLGHSRHEREVELQGKIVIVKCVGPNKNISDIDIETA